MKLYIYRIAAVFIALTLMNCGDNTSNDEEAAAENEATASNTMQITQSQFNMNKMELGGLENKEFSTVVSVNGMIDVPPENRAVVSATMGGYIKTTPLLVGDVVKKGQVLVTLENPDFVKLQQEYMEVHEQLNYLKSEYDRHVSMKSENIISQKNFLKVESEYKTAVATHKGLEKQLSLLNISPAQTRQGNISSVVNIYAPISGSITQVNVTKGSYVSPATAIVEIIDTDHIHLELSVFEKDILKVKKGQKINFSIPETSNETYHAEVYLVGTSISAKRTIKVHAHLDEDSPTNFLTGMFVNADVVVESAFAKALPSNAVVEVDGKYYVVVLDAKNGDTYTFTPQEVQIEKSYLGYTKITNTDQFPADAQFLTSGAFNLLAE
jgi:cobalt-zinc-cadmium efflux system membrane fusion protein